MVANGGGSIPATPEMMAAQPNTREWIRAWVESFEGDIQEEAEVLSAKLISKGCVMAPQRLLGASAALLQPPLSPQDSKSNPKADTCGG